MKNTTIPTQYRAPLFELGQTVATPGALALVSDPWELFPLLTRHHRGDWIDTGKDADAGEMSDWELNDMALRDGGRIFTVAHVAGEKIYIITEAKGDDGRRASTCIMRAEDY